MARSKLPPLSALRTFEAVARHASFKLAAVELSVTPTAVSHQIRQLEQHLGVRVLDRSPRSVALTAEGSALYEVTSSSLASIADVVRGLRKGTTTRRVTLSSTAAFLSQWLAPRLTPLRAALSDIDLRLHHSDSMADLRAGTIDAAIRYGKGPYGSSVELCADAFAPVCSPSLGISSLVDLRRATLIHVDGRTRPRPSADWNNWFDKNGTRGMDVQAGLHFPDSLLAVHAAIAGQGVAILSLVLVADALTAGLLVAPFSTTLAGDAYHFVCAPGLEDRADIVTLRAWFARELNQVVEVPTQARIARVKAAKKRRA